MKPASAHIFTLPDLGEGLTEAEIVTWMVGAGDHVVADQPLVAVETDKAVVEIPSPQAGRIVRLLAGPHERIAIGTPLLEFATGDEGDAGAIVGDLRVETTKPVAPARAAPEAPTLPQAVPPAAHPAAAPAVRILAAQHGIDLAAITPSGPGGSISRADVERAAERGAAAQVVAQQNEEAEPLRGVRRAMAVRMAEAGAATVPATITDEADLAAWGAGTSVMARLVQAMVAGCRAEPALNAHFDGQAMTRRLHRAVHLAIAMDTPDGLIVPVLRDAGALDAGGLHTTLERLKNAVRTRRIAPAALRGATISLSNFGPLGGIYANLVVVPPQVAILGAGRIAPRAMAVGSSCAIHRVLPLSLTFDHRAVSGGEAARFLSAVKAALESPAATP